MQKIKAKENNIFLKKKKLKMANARLTLHVVDGITPSVYQPKL